MQLLDVEIELIENVDFNDRNYLRERDIYHILRNDCVNMRNKYFIKYQFSNLVLNNSYFQLSRTCTNKW